MAVTTCGGAGVGAVPEALVEATIGGGAGVGAVPEAFPAVTSGEGEAASGSAVVTKYWGEGAW